MKEIKILSMIEAEKLIKINTAKNGCINWYNISTEQLPVEFIEKYFDEIYWDIYFKYHRNVQEEFLERFLNSESYILSISTWEENLSENFIEKILENFIGEEPDEDNDFQEMLIFNILDYQNIDETFIENHIKQLGGYDMIISSFRRKFSENFLRKHVNEFSFHTLCSNQNLSEKFMRDFSDKLDWDEVSRNQKLSEEFIRDFSDKLNWRCMTSSQKLSEKLIRDFSYKIDRWNNISSEQTLSEKFIRDFSDKLNWYFISRCQKLSKDFIIENYRKIRWDMLGENEKISPEIKKRWKQEIDFYTKRNQKWKKRKFYE